MGDDRIAQCRIGQSGEHGDLHPPMISPAATPTAMKPRMRSLVVSMSAFKKPPVSDRVRVRRTLAMGMLARR